MSFLKGIFGKKEPKYAALCADDDEDIYGVDDVASPNDSSSMTSQSDSSSVSYPSLFPPSGPPPPPQQQQQSQMYYGGYDYYNYFQQQTPYSATDAPNYPSLQPPPPADPAPQPKKSKKKKTATVSRSSSEYAEAKANYDTFGEKNPWTIVNMIPAPDKCERCNKYPPQIRCLNTGAGTLEFICYQCREDDGSLNKLPVDDIKKLG